MRVVRPEFRPAPGLDTDAMASRQRDIAAVADFADDHGLTPERIGLDEPPGEQAALGGATTSGEAAPVVVGVDQAFRDDEVSVSAAVAIRDGAVIERAAGNAPLDVPYVPGLLAFREGSAVIDALSSLSVEPDLLVVDGSGRIHYRQAGLATHVGVLFDVPAVGVAKSLLCGTPAAALADPLPAGTRVAIEADDSMDAPDGAVVGYALQSRQYPTPETRHINPLYVSPGHRVSAGTAADLVEATCTQYKLPAPTRLADQYAADLT
ncbi:MULTISPECIES: endonuclease V [Halobacterium]|uniref:Endonuclease V n=6 Tax=Halobacterium salinarum TaxID=2242 RepID=NFI_HALSA|nr:MULTISPECIES: endonuclease V [Halobacterium]Q9HS81.3 RecName: Full=Endonuclease V; AltName: Full=Deoxyinosine 3'endonuclease; AltName: Full=Deoxyribonuclease V; Short=DNase V [Halobacterium salinarum NRC-1]AAG18927.1 endonuclease V [Halobacterium salinarum NRC-1]MBB6089759.1 deoxyribonuclease V [Halobacterium salinarum]MCF2164150.1 endonuclease V [Halobacterium salinarum]MCF2167774.1 endonuclease V [Halobacterium salinarum]MCF2238996.1 endonuclease V [Halobacterium salinarum]